MDFSDILDSMSWKLSFRSMPSALSDPKASYYASYAIAMYEPR